MSRRIQLVLFFQSIVLVPLDDFIFIYSANDEAKINVKMY